MNYYLSLGSNLGERKNNLKAACMLLELEPIKILRFSSIYETQPVDVVSQPWFFNQVVEIDTDQSPYQVLQTIKNIERTMGRKITSPKGPRKIDIDILLAGDLIVHTDDLQLPHPHMHRRNFVLIPLNELDPDAVHPIFRKTIKNLMQESADQAEVKKMETD